MTNAINIQRKDDVDSSANGEPKKPILLVLSSIYIPPYFDPLHKKGAGFLKALAENFFHNPPSNTEDQVGPPWYVSNYDDVTVGFTNDLHRFNDAKVIQSVLTVFINYILSLDEHAKMNPEEKEKIRNNLESAVASLTMSEQELKELPGDAGKGFSLLSRYVDGFVDFLVLNRAAVLFDDVLDSMSQGLNQDGSFMEAVEFASTRYTERADQWKAKLDDAFEENKNGISLSTTYWKDLRKGDESYQTAKDLFLGWWRNSQTGIKKTVLKYIKEFTVGKYDDSFNKVGDYERRLTPITSALFVLEELITFLAMVLRNGPYVLIYPTPNLGAKSESNSTPFTALAELMQNDLTVQQLMREKHGTEADQPYIQYTYPNKKPAPKAASVAASDNAVASSPPGGSEAAPSWAKDIQNQVKVLAEQNARLAEQNENLMKEVQTMKRNILDFATAMKTSPPGSRNNSEEYKQDEEAPDQLTRSSSAELAEVVDSSLKEPAKLRSKTEGEQQKNQKKKKQKGQQRKPVGQEDLKLGGTQAKVGAGPAEVSAAGQLVNIGKPPAYPSQAGLFGQPKHCRGFTQNPGQRGGFAPGSPPKG